MVVTMDAGITSLPQELIDTIINENSVDDTTLRACSLVSRSWTYPSQRRIFSHINLNRQSRHYHSLHSRRRQDLERCVSFVSTHPFIPTFVQSIEISPLLDAHLLATILKKLANLENISLHLCGYSWDELSLSMRDILLTAFRSPRLTKLDIRDGQFLRCADFETLLKACHNLTHLSLSAISCEEMVSWGSLEGLALIPNGPELQLRAIALNLCDPYSALVQLLHRSITVGSLHRLSVLTDGSGDLAKRTKATKEILRLLNSSPLEHLTLNVCLVEPLSSLMDISRLRSIHVKMWWLYFQQHTSPVEWLRWLTGLFKEFSKWHRLEEVTLEIFYQSAFTSHSDDWAALDATLGQIRSLGKVRMGLNAYDSMKAQWKYSREYPDCVTRDARRALPILVKRGILSIEVAANYPG